MKILATAAAIAFAATGFIAQAQSYARQFTTAKPELDKLMAAMQYKDVAEKINSILPASIPDFPKDPSNPQVALSNYAELGTIQDFHEILFKAYFASGDIDRAILTAKKAEEIAVMNAEDVAKGLSAPIELWTTAIENSKKELEMIAQRKEQLGVELKKAKGKKAKELEGELARIDSDASILERNLQDGPTVLSQLNKYISDANRETTKFKKDIADMESDLSAEKTEIASEFKGDIGKYVAAAIAPNTLAKFQSQREKVRFLNRLLFLSPQNADVKKQLDLALAK
jgi:hypothetical protein